MSWDDDPPTEPPYRPTCAECAHAHDIGLADGGICTLRFEETGDYGTISHVGWDWAACGGWEES